MFKSYQSKQVKTKKIKTNSLVCLALVLSLEFRIPRPDVAHVEKPRVASPQIHIQAWATPHITDKGPEAQGKARQPAHAQWGPRLEVPIPTNAQDRGARRPGLPDKWSGLEGQMGVASINLAPKNHGSVQVHRHYKYNSEWQACTRTRGEPGSLRPGRDSGGQQLLSRA